MIYSRTIICSLLILCLNTITYSQDSVSWTFTAHRISEKKFEVKLAANFASGWHIYSQNTPNGGPVPTAIVFNKNSIIELTGSVKEIGVLRKEFQDVFNVEVYYYENKVEFLQVINLKADAKTTLNGSIEYMLCNDRECLPPKTIPFSIAIK